VLDHHVLVAENGVITGIEPENTAFGPCEIIDAEGGMLRRDL